jgi:hypothetical protein
MAFEEATITAGYLGRKFKKHTIACGIRNRERYNLDFWVSVTSQGKAGANMRQAVTVHLQQKSAGRIRRNKGGNKNHNILA